MKTKKALGGLFGLFGSLAAFFARFAARAFFLLSLFTNTKGDIKSMRSSADLVLFTVAICGAKDNQ